jgi:hypothetical protein
VIAHIVLLQPRPDLTDAQRADALAVLSKAAAGVPEIRTLRLYLQAPAHVALGELFYRATSAALAYDYAWEDVVPA